MKRKDHQTKLSNKEKDYLRKAKMKRKEHQTKLSNKEKDYPQNRIVYSPELNISNI